MKRTLKHLTFVYFSKRAMNDEEFKRMKLYLRSQKETVGKTEVDGRIIYFGFETSEGLNTFLLEMEQMLKRQGFIVEKKKT